jgi:hypothetical protein
VSPIIMSDVFDPLGAADVILLTGDQAWNLPAKYIAQGGKASGYNPEEDPDYRFPDRTRLLSAMLGRYAATPERWLELFDLTRYLRVSATSDVCGRGGGLNRQDDRDGRIRAIDPDGTWHRDDRGYADIPLTAPLTGLHVAGQFPTLGIRLGDHRPHGRGKHREYLPL